MKNNHAEAYTPPDRGICSGCDHLLTCQLHKEEEGPVLFCEEFACVPKTPRRPKPKLYGLPGGSQEGLAVRKSAQAASNYIGLCRTCSRLSACPRLKPGGGTWQCESYEKDPTCLPGKAAGEKRRTKR